MRSTIIFLILFLLFSTTADARTYVVRNQKNYVITIINHRFVPQIITIPARRKIKITIRNQDPALVEFKSDDLKLTKKIPEKSEITLFVGALNPARYDYFSDFATCAIIAR